MNNAILIQHADAPWDKLLDLTEKRTRAYCERHKIDYRQYRGPQDCEGRSFHWYKVDFARRALAEGYQYVFWLDCDTIIASDEDLRAAAPCDGLFMTWHHLDEWPPQCYDHFNVGCFYVHNGPDAQVMFDAWWNAPKHEHPWHEQHTINRLIHESESPPVRARRDCMVPVDAIDSRWNSIYPEFLSPKPVVMAWHGWGDLQARYDAMAAALAELEGGKVASVPQAVREVGAQGQIMDIAILLDRASHALQEKKYDQCEHELRNILAQAPNEPQAHLIYCELLGRYNRPDEAEKHARHAVAIDSSNGSAWAVLAAAICWQGRHEEAEQYYRKGLELCPDMPTAHWNFALNLLIQGKYEEGFKHYEWGKLNTKGLRTRVLQPEWYGDPIPGGVLWVWGEQGRGDTIQFARYLKKAREDSRCSKLILECHDDLVGLFLESGLADEVYRFRPDNGVPFKWDEHVSLMTLVRRYWAEDEDVPYLKAEPLDIRVEGLKVGVCMKGSPDHANDHNRSIPSEMFADLIQTGGCAFFNLTKDTSTLPMADWAQTAKLVAAMDLIITVDTGVAHLAGALGKETWLLLPFVGDWRWGFEGEKTAWYPTVDLYRQQKRGDWSLPIKAAQVNLWLRTSSDAKTVIRAGWESASRPTTDMFPRHEFEAVVDTIQRAGTTRHAQLLYGLVKWLQPERVVEVGTWRGYTAMWMARALQENGKGEIVCIDDFSLDGADIDALQNNVELCGVGPVVAIMPGKSAELDWPECDFAYIDGDHSYEGCQADFLKALNSGAHCIVLHDTTAWWGPRRFVDEWKYGRPDSSWGVIEMAFDEGLAIFLKTGERPALTYTQGEFPTGAIENLAKNGHGPKVVPVKKEEPVASA